MLHLRTFAKFENKIDSILSERYSVADTLYVGITVCVNEIMSRLRLQRTKLIH